MRQLWPKWILLILVVLPFVAAAQDFQFLPEIDTYYAINSNLRVYFQAKETREPDQPTTAEIGPSLDFHIKELGKLKDVTAFDLDKAKSQLLLFSIGYRYEPTPGRPPTNRLEPYVTINLPSPGRLLLTDRNRADLDWKSGNFSWHYRNRFNVERPWQIHGYHLQPYLAAEFWYTSQFSKWSTTSLFAGCIFPIGKHVDLDPYYEHQNNTGAPRNEQLSQLGLILNLWF